MLRERHEMSRKKIVRIFDEFALHECDHDRAHVHKKKKQSEAGLEDGICRAYDNARFKKLVDAFCDLLETQGREVIIEAFARASSYVSGRRVSVDQDGATLHGTTAGLNDSGFLILDADDGSRSVIVAGGVRPCS